MDRLGVMLGGRAAEAMVFQTSTSGAEQDLKMAMDLARKMVLDWGMGDKLQNLALGGPGQPYPDGRSERPNYYSELTAEKIDMEVKRILDEAFEVAQTALRDNRTGLDLLAQRLIDKEEVSGKEVIELLKREVTR